MQHFQTAPSVLALPTEALRRICDMLIAATKAPAGVNRDQSDYEYAGLQGVLSLTRTCRLLHEHAADALWESIPSFGVLVYTLPRDIWTCEKLDLGDDEDPEAGLLDLVCPKILPS